MRESIQYTWIMCRLLAIYYLFQLKNAIEINNGIINYWKLNQFMWRCLLISSLFLWKKGTKIKTHAKSFLNPHIERRCELKAPYLLHTEISLHIPFSDKVFKYMRLQRENRGCSRVNFKISYHFGDLLQLSWHNGNSTRIGQTWKQTIHFTISHQISLESFRWLLTKRV